MKQVALVLPYDYKLFSVASVLDVFDTVNSIYEHRKKELPFQVTLVQTPEQIKLHGRTFHGHPVRSIGSRTHTDIVLIPSFTTKKISETIDRNKSFIPWLQKQFKSGAEIASLCTGAYLFAASGLLNGKLATTHADYCPDLIVSYPSVFVKPGRTITVDERCYTSGGSTSAFHLLVFLVQKYCGNETKHECRICRN